MAPKIKKPLWVINKMFLLEKRSMTVPAIKVRIKIGMNWQADRTPTKKAELVIL
jgi:hypothetical protein